jgi:uncharacterized protein
MKKAKKLMMIWTAIVVVAGVAGLNVLAYNHARGMMSFSDSGIRTDKPDALSFGSKAKILFTGVTVPRPVGTSTPSDLNPDCTSLTVSTEDGITIGCWYCNRGKESPLTVLFHGYTAEKTALLPEAKALLDMGSSVLLVDFRGSGESSESYTTIGVHEAKDVTAVIQYAEQNLSHKKTILWGQSMGAVSILKAAHEYGLTADGVILEATFDTLLNTVQNRFKIMNIPSFPFAELLVFWGGHQGGYNGFRHNPVDYAPSLNCPALFMHGSDDPRAKISEGQRVYDATPSPKKFITFQQAGHESYASTNEKKWSTSVGNFIKDLEFKNETH